MYLTIWIGLTPVPIPKLFHSGDYSYGIYLYHDPILQIIIAMLPLSLITGTGGWVLLVGLGLPIVACLAAFSWHNIEKPVLSLRKKFSFVAQMRAV
jgi:peptidoglycan/LPS O-acetylase OafA/YrhL